MIDTENEKTEPETANTGRQGEISATHANPLESIFSSMGVRMEMTTLPERVVEAAQSFMDPFRNLRIDEGSVPEPLTPEKRVEFLQVLMERLLGHIGYPGAQVGYFQGDKNFFKDRMATVTGYPGKAFVENFSFRDSQGSTYIVEVGFTPRRGFEANMNYIPFRGTPTKSTPFATTPSSPAASGPGSGV